VSARWRTLRTRLRLPEDFRIHDWRHSKVTNDLEAGENPVEVSANVRHHSPGYTMARYGHSRKDGARRLADSACHPWSDLGSPGCWVTWLVTPQPEKQKNPR
jgi:integrase